jgi:hypothetical protein
MHALFLHIILQQMERNLDVLMVLVVVAIVAAGKKKKKRKLILGVRCGYNMMLADYSQKFTFNNFASFLAWMKLRTVSYLSPSDIIII